VAEHTDGRRRRLANERADAGARFRHLPRSIVGVAYRRCRRAW
jgi:hypothetical protein